MELCVVAISFLGVTSAFPIPQPWDLTQIDRHGCKSVFQYSSVRKIVDVLSPFADEFVATSDGSE